MKKLIVLLVASGFTFSLGKAKEIPMLQDEDCMKANLFFEARGETVEGMKAVAAVTYNRLWSIAYPSTICKVVFQAKQFSWTHQVSYKEFTDVAEGRLDGYNAKDRAKYLVAEKIAYMPSSEVQKVLPKGTLFYHSVKVNPVWNKKMQKVKQVGGHVFLKQQNKSSCKNTTCKKSN